MDTYLVSGDERYVYGKPKDANGIPCANYATMLY
jgi:hypothetical protein